MTGPAPSSGRRAARILGWLLLVLSVPPALLGILALSRAPFESVTGTGSIGDDVAHNDGDAFFALAAVMAVLWLLLLGGATLLLWLGRHAGDRGRTRPVRLIVGGLLVALSAAALLETLAQLDDKRAGWERSVQLCGVVWLLLCASGVTLVLMAMRRIHEEQRSERALS